MQRSRQQRWLSITAFVLAIAILALPSRSQAPTGKGAAAAPDATGHWHGVWAAPGGWVYEADFQITEGLGNAVVADIHWTLRQADPSRTDYQGKVGMTGVEHTKGIFFPAVGVVSLEGYALDDPNTILGMDKYRLILSDDGTTLGGITWDHGDWNGQFFAKRQAN